MNKINDILARVASIAEQNYSRCLSMKAQMHIDCSMPLRNSVSENLTMIEVT